MGNPTRHLGGYLTAGANEPPLARGSLREIKPRDIYPNRGRMRGTGGTRVVPIGPVADHGNPCLVPDAPRIGNDTR